MTADYEAREAEWDEGWRAGLVTIGSPAVASGFTFAPPASEALRLVLASFVLVTDANAANRIVRLEYLNSSGGVFAAVAAPALQVASITTRYTFAVGLMPFGAASAAFMGAPLPDITLRDGLGIRAAVTAVQAGDQISSVSLYVSQRPVRE